MEKNSQHVIKERLEAVDFTWVDGKAMKPVYKTLDGSLAKLIGGFLMQ